MKKFWLIGLSMLMMLGLLGCGSDVGKAEQKASAPAPQKVADTVPPAGKGKILVAFFRLRAIRSSWQKALPRLWERISMKSVLPTPTPARI